MHAKGGFVQILTQYSSCSFFQWAEFDDDGNPPWADKVTATVTDTAVVAAVETATVTDSLPAPVIDEQDVQSPLECS